MAPKHSLTTALFFCLTLFFAQSRALNGGRQCFFSNGKEAPGYTPCDADAENSPCCDGAAGYTCLGKTLCRGPNQELVRGACTNSNWPPGGGCNRYCFGVWDTAAVLGKCATDNSNETGGNYCCQDEEKAGGQWYWFTHEDMQPLASWNQEKQQFVALKAKPSTTSAGGGGGGGATVTVINGTPQGTVTGTITVSISVPVGASTTTTTTTETSAPGLDGQTEEKKDSGLPAGAWAGLGIGAFVVFVLLSVLGFMLWKRHKSKKAGAAGGEDPGSGRFELFGSSTLKLPRGFNELPTDSDMSEMDSKSSYRRELPTGIEAAEMDAKGLDMGELPTGKEAVEMEANDRKELPAGPGHGRTELYAGPPTHYVELPTERYY